MSEEHGAGAHLNDVRGAAREYLERVGGPGRNWEAVKDLRAAVDLAVVEYEQAHPAPIPGVRPGEHPSDDPVWTTPRPGSLAEAMWDANAAIDEVRRALERGEGPAGPAFYRNGRFVG